jgi:hypothetical protein
MIEHETLGAHIRNILTPYANIIQLLEDIHENDDERIKEFLLTKVDPKKLQKNLNHFIEVSKLKEVEDINWRKTDLCDKYYKEIENS